MTGGDFVLEGLSAQDGLWLVGREGAGPKASGVVTWEQVSRSTHLQGQHGMSCDMDTRDTQKCSE